MEIENSFSIADEKWMRRALEMAKQAEQVGEVPVGAVLVKDGLLIAEGYNQPISSCDPTAHAEIVTLRKAGPEQKNYRLPGTTLYVTLEPCPMCAGAMIHARIERLVYAAIDPRTGAAGSVFNLINDHRHNHQIRLEQGLFEPEASELLKNFFRKKRF
ncbi:MAG TPA: tRNA adenosine(34) deaminase TadA [Chromatiales bacterium]|nr:tRNA adenosine(34) deaminase TadA [Chromatiales bacterium]